MSKNTENADKPKLYFNYYDLMRDWEPRPQWLDAGIIWKKTLADIEEAAEVEDTPDGVWRVVWHKLSRYADSFIFFARVASYLAAVDRKGVSTGSEYLQRAQTFGSVLYELVDEYVEWVGGEPESWEQAHAWSKNLVRAMLLATAQYLHTSADQNRRD